METNTILNKNENIIGHQNRVTAPAAAPATEPGYDCPEPDWFGTVRWCREDIEANLPDDMEIEADDFISKIEDILRGDGFRQTLVEFGNTVIQGVICDNLP